MPTPYIDRIDNLSLTEKDGTIRSLTRKARVCWKPGEAWPQDYSVLTAALAVLPQAFSTLPAPYESLSLVERSPSIAENDPGTVDVILKYEHILDGPHQILRDDVENRRLPRPSGILFGKGRCSITEKTTNFYYPYGDTKAGRVQILTAHTFPTWETGIAGIPLNPNFPFTIFQGGEVTIPFPQANFQLQGVMVVDNPFAVGQLFIATINDGLWLNQPKWTWLCSEVSWDMMEIDQSIYRFGFEFQYNLDTWNPTVTFNDQRTGRPPSGVQYAAQPNPDPNSPDGKAGVISYVGNNLIPLPIREKRSDLGLQPAGIWQVPALRPVNFNQLFGQVFEGQAPPGVQ